MKIGGKRLEVQEVDNGLRKAAVGKKKFVALELLSIVVVIATVASVVERHCGNGKMGKWKKIKLQEGLNF